jgi:hypothetical protein
MYEGFMNCSPEEHQKQIQISDGMSIANTIQVKLSRMAVSAQLPYPTDFVDHSIPSIRAKCAFNSCLTCRVPDHRYLTYAGYNKILIGKQATPTAWVNASTRTCYSCGRECKNISGCGYITQTNDVDGCEKERFWPSETKFRDIRRIGNVVRRKTCPNYT